MNTNQYLNKNLDFFLNLLFILYEKKFSLCKCSSLYFCHVMMWLKGKRKEKKK